MKGRGRVKVRGRGRLHEARLTASVGEHACSPSGRVLTTRGIG